MNVEITDPTKTFYSTIVEYDKAEYGLMVIGFDAINHEIRFHGKEAKMNANRAQRLIQAMILSIGGQFVVVAE